jgi:hypothetical protein
LFPFGDLGQYFYGKLCLPAGVMQQHFKYTDQFTSICAPKVSVHATGWVQIEKSTGKDRVGPLYIPALATLQDAIIATISVTDIAKLRKASQPKREDLVIAVNTLLGLTAVVYLNQASKFRHRFGSGTRLEVAKLEAEKCTMYIGVELARLKPSAENGAPGFELLVGLNPTDRPGSTREMLYIIGR